MPMPPRLKSLRWWICREFYLRRHLKHCLDHFTVHPPPPPPPLMGNALSFIGSGISSLRHLSEGLCDVCVLVCRKWPVMLWDTQVCQGWKRGWWWRWWWWGWGGWGPIRCWNVAPFSGAESPILERVMTVMVEGGCKQKSGKNNTTVLLPCSIKWLLGLRLFWDFKAFIHFHIFNTEMRINKCVLSQDSY